MPIRSNSVEVSGKLLCRTEINLHYELVQWDRKHEASATSTPSSLSKEALNAPSYKTSVTKTPNFLCTKRFEYDHHLEYDKINFKKEFSFDSHPMPPYLDHVEPLFMEYGELSTLDIQLDITTSSF